MGLVDNLSGAVKELARQVETAALPALLSAALAKTDLKMCRACWISFSNRVLDRKYLLGLVTARTYRSPLTNLRLRWAMSRSNR